MLSSSLAQSISPLLVLQVASITLFSSAACNRDRNTRYGGDIRPCDVSLATPKSGEASWREDGLAASKHERFWEDGPYHTWNTAPSTRCERNLTPAKDARGVSPALYVTYPARENPTTSGVGDVADGPFPIILFAHANHDRECQIFDGYYSLHDHWASWGFIVVSVDSTRLNCQRGNQQNIIDRAHDQRTALAHMRAINEDPTSPFFGRVDTSRVIFAGHSRGGGASMLNATELEDVSAVINLQGVSMSAYGFGTPTVNAPTMGITAGLDVDLNFPAVEGNEELLAGEYTWVDLAGAIHAWTGDTSPEEFDDRPDLEKSEQHDLTEYFTTAHLAHHVGAASEGGPPPHSPRDLSHLLFSHQGMIAAHAKILPGSVRMRWREPEHEILVDDFNNFIRQDTNLLGGAYTFVGASRRAVTFSHNPEQLEEDEDGEAIFFSRSARALWIETTTTPGLLVARMSAAPGGAIEVPANYRLQARVRARPGWSTPYFELEVILAGGSSHTLSSQDATRWGVIPDRYVQIDAPLVENPADDETLKVEEIRLHILDGTLILDDLRFTPPNKLTE